MHIVPYLFFNGDCEVAFNFYAKLFGGKIEAMMPHAGSPAEAGVPKEWYPKILHACLKVGDQVIMASDAPPGHYHVPQGFAVSLAVPTVADTKRIFDGLATGGKVTMPLSETFFSKSFGMVVDQFGISWMVICESAKP